MKSRFLSPHYHWSDLSCRLVSPTAERYVIFCPSSAGTFTLTYGGKNTEPIAYDANADDVASAVGSLSPFAGSNVTAVTTNCTSPELTCAWHLTFALYGDVELLIPDVKDLGGNAAGITVTEEIRGQDATNVGDSPITVRNSHSKIGCDVRENLRCAHCIKTSPCGRASE